MPNGSQPAQRLLARTRQGRMTDAPGQEGPTRDVPAARAVDLVKIYG